MASTARVGGACLLRRRAPARSQVGDVPPFGADPAVVYVEQLSSPLEQPEVLIEGTIGTVLPTRRSGPEATM